MDRQYTSRNPRGRRPSPSRQPLQQPPQPNNRRCFVIIGIFVTLFLAVLMVSVALLVVNNITDDGNSGSVSRTEAPTTNKPGGPGSEVCIDQRTTTSCYYLPCQGRYRTYDSTCNNEHYPLWGASEIPFTRFLPPLYEDGLNTPIGWDPFRKYNGHLLPNPRVVSTEILATESQSESSIFSGLLQTYGQYLTTDMDHIPKTNSLCTEACMQSLPYCFPIFAPENDPRLETGECIALTRSTRVCGLEPRQQLNSVTSYIDGSPIYGSIESRAMGRRELTNNYGYLKEGVRVNADGIQSKPLLPFNTDFPNGCARPRDDTSGIPCFFSGDIRANENLGLASLHTIWSREHNRIAEELRRINPAWNGETLYQEARKIVGGLHQKVAMEDYLPKIVGSKGMDLLGPYTGYNSITPASTSNQFATATFRFGHAQIPKTVFRLGPDFTETRYGNLNLHETAFTPARLVNEGGIDPILRGLYGIALKEINAEQIMSDELTENLFALARDIALDLGAVNIQRGRDHGLPGYNDWRRFCDLPVAYSFDDLASVISDPNVRRKLESYYGHPGNMDLFVAGLVEDPWYDSLVGPTFTCLIVEHFRRLRDGDRYWYENPGQFTSHQLTELKKQSLAKMFCESGDNIQHVQTDVFERATYPQDYKTCDQISGMNIESAWKDLSGAPECPNFVSTPVPPHEEEVCLTAQTPVSCPSNTCHSEYRAQDGTCNNQNNPLWGAARIPFKRFLPADYEDGINTPNGWDPNRYYNGYKLPNPRVVSQEVLTTDKETLNEDFSDLMMIYGQYITTDIDHIPKTNSLCTENCVQKAPYCFPILAPENDPRLQTGECIALTRSTRVCGLEPRQQLNSITSYIDAGNKYGNDEARAHALRDFTNELGHLKDGASVNTFTGDVTKPLLPFTVPEFPQGCNRPRTDNSGIPCFFSGDVRANENLGMAALHTVWNREHNHIADQLKAINPLWSGETLYQEARKIVGALNQKIALDDWLPKTVGSKGMELLGPYHGYNPSVEASTSIVFATAAFRFGHAQIPKTVFRLGPDFREDYYGNLDLHETAFCPSKFVNEGGIDGVLRGMYGTALKEILPQEIMAEELTENLFALTRDVALDLASINIQRGRDHGLPRYNDWRQFCNLPMARTFDDLANEITDAEIRRKLQLLYGHPGNMDLFVAGLVEDPWYDSLVGPTFTCIIVEQFRRLRDGDRFWYENTGVFTASQLSELKKQTLARVICNSGDNIQHIQDDVFERANFPYGYKTCTQIPGMELSLAWRDTSGGRECPVFHDITLPPPPPTAEPEEVCLPQRTTAICMQHSCQQKYRTYDGTCNNADYPLWGASQIPFKRLLSPIYEDGINTPVGWNPNKSYLGYRLPNPRLVTQEVLTSESLSQSSIYSGLLMSYGQYLTTDIDHTPKTNSLCTETCTQKAPYCFPVLPPEDDPRITTGNCIPLTRSTRVCGLEPRQQLISITSYIDASTVYGSDESRALERRNLDNDYGHLKMGVRVNAYGILSKPLLPFNEGFPNGCNRPRDDTSGIECFFSGDVRTNENLGMASLHTIWARDHNRIADELRTINPHWNGETLYQESRKIIVALHQKVAMEEYLPKTVGSKGMELLGRYNGYNPRTDATASISFATATFRFGHAQIPDTVFRLGPDFKEAPYGNLPLHETAFTPARLVNEGSIDPVLRGLFGTPLKDINGQEIMSDELTERLFALTRDVALDLSTINIQRGRDHGLPLYNQWRTFCNLHTVNSFDDLANDISDPNLRRKLQELYGHPGNMDLWVAGLVEDPWYDSLVGPTFTCLIVEQFRRLRDGDRFWYENPGVFTSAQLLELKKHSLARVICDSSDNIQEVQEDVFERATYPVDYKRCSQIHSMNIAHAWKDTSDAQDCPVFPDLPVPPPQPTVPAVEVCLTPRSNAQCTLDNCELKYRTFDGTCNNQRFPLWGASSTAFRRIVESVYEDELDIPLGWDPYKTYFNYPLPNPRLVTQGIVTTEMMSQSSIYSGLLMMYGQYITAEIDHIQKRNSLCTEACSQISPYCFPVPAPANDTRLKPGECIPLTRSTRVCDIEPREQLNGVTSYIDAGVLYSSVDDRAMTRRDLTNEYGHLKEGVVVNTYGGPSKPLLPFNIYNFPNGCNRPRTDTSNIPCFFSGDPRTNENLGLASIHTIWNREHNRIADELRHINPFWNGETLFQEARKILGALHQKVAFEDWLPKTIGSEGMKLIGPYNGYEQYTDASTSISFATATFRFGHAQIPAIVTRLGPDFMEAPYGNLKLHETAFNPSKIVNEGGIDPILRGFFGMPLKDIKSTEIMSDELTERLFALTRDVALDLSTINIQRGRDHGLAGYNAWRSYCHFPVVNTFDDLAGTISDPKVRDKLKELYGHPGNMDLWVAGLVEDPWYDSLVGPTFTCLIAEQFKRLRNGDRFWYENPGQFTSAQLQEIKKHTLAKVICESADHIEEVQYDVFEKAFYPMDFHSCRNIPGMDVSAWHDTTGSGGCI